MGHFVCTVHPWSKCVRKAQHHTAAHCQTLHYSTTHCNTLISQTHEITCNTVLPTHVQWLSGRCVFPGLFEPLVLGLHPKIRSSFVVANMLSRNNKRTRNKENWVMTKVLFNIWRFLWTITFVVCRLLPSPAMCHGDRDIVTIALFHRTNTGASEWLLVWGFSEASLVERR